MTEHTPRWFLAYCASIIQFFGVDSTALRSTVYMFQEATYEDALTMYDRPVIWTMTKCGALPDSTDAKLHAATSVHHWTCRPQATNRRPSYPKVGNNEFHLNPSQTHGAQPFQKLESTGGASEQPGPNRTQMPTRPSPSTAKSSGRVPKSRRTTMPARHQPRSQAPYRSQPQPAQGGHTKSTNTDQNHGSRRRTSEQSNGPRSKLQFTRGTEQQASRKRSQPDQDPALPSKEPIW